MRILIDTHILIWHLEDDAHLSAARSEIITDPDNQVLISIASLWEIAIKLSTGKLALSKTINELVFHIQESTSSFLSIEPDYLMRVASLPFHHRDPFDRLIIAQSLVENIPVLTTDSNFAAYGVALL